MDDGITLEAIFKKAATTIDGGWIISFECNQDQAKEIMRLAELRDMRLQLGVVLF